MSFACHTCDDRWMNTPHPDGIGVWIVGCPLCDLHIRSMAPVQLVTATGSRFISQSPREGAHYGFICGMRLVAIHEPPRPNDHWSGAAFAEYVGLHAPFENAVPAGVQFPVSR